MLVLIYWGSSVQVIITVSVFGDLIVQDLFVNAWPAFARTIFSFSLALSPFSRRWAALMKIEYKTNWIVMIDDDLKNGRNKLGLSFRAKYDQSWLNVFFFYVDYDDRCCQIVIEMKNALIHDVLEVFEVFLVCCAYFKLESKISLSFNASLC